MPVKSDTFKHFKPFQDISPGALEALAQAASRKSFEDGHIIQLEAEDVQAVFFVVKGNIKIYRSNLNGRQQNLVHLRPGDIFNLPVAFLKDTQTHTEAAAKTIATARTIARARANAIALGPVEVITIPFQAFRSLASHNPEIAMRVFEMLSRKISELTELSYDLSLRSVRGRLARFLLNNTGPDTGQWTQADIAAQIGTVREVVSRTLRSFVKEGLISLERQQIVIQDPERLEQESNE